MSDVLLLCCLWSVNLSLHAQNVDIADVLSELRRRFGVSGVDEKASRK